MRAGYGWRSMLEMALVEFGEGPRFGSGLRGGKAGTRSSSVPHVYCTWVTPAQRRECKYLPTKCNGTVA